MAKGDDPAGSHPGRRWALVAAFVVLAAFCADANGWTQRLDLWLSDQRSRLVTREVELDVTMVDIDAASLAEIGLWPWPRSLHARMLDEASALGARTVAFDIDFSTASNPVDDAAFTQALERSSAESLLAAFVQQASIRSGRLAASLPIEPFLALSWPAAVNVPVDPDGEVRRFTAFVETQDEILTSMPALLAGRDAAQEVFGIDLSIDPRTLQRVSFVDLVEGRVPREAVEGRALLVGATALELRDLFTMPGHGTVSGSTIIALAAETLFQNRAMAPVPVPGWAFLLVGVLAILMPRAAKGRRTIVLLAVAAATVEFAALWLHHRAQLELRSGGLQLAFAGIAAVALLRAFDLKTLLLAVSRIETANSRAMMDRMIEDGFDAIIVVDDAGRVVRSNRAARALSLPGLGEGAVASLDDLPASVRETALAARRSGPADERTLRDVSLGEGDDALILEYSIAALDLAPLNRRASLPKGERLLCLTFRDVTQARRAQEHMRRLAMQDSLTGLANRRALELRIDELGADGRSVALILFDLDRFKGVNDLLGHDIGDLVLVETGRRAQAALGAATFLARIGGDEFAAILDGADERTVRSLADALAGAVERPMDVGGHRVSVGLSAGFARACGPGAGLQTLMTAADMALQEAKRSLTARRVVAFVPGMDEGRQRRLALEADLASALETDQFELVYQPQVDIASGRIIGAEALMRWHHPVRGPVSPGIFIPLCEETGMIHALGRWALQAACRDAVSWGRAIPVAVNVSSLQFQKGDLAELVDEALVRSGLSASRLELEITESAFVRDGAELTGIFERLTARGIHFSLDDFGTGYSSLGYLHRFPISKIKIDRSFVTGLPSDGHSLAIVRSIMALGEGLGMRVIAEGIETQRQAEALTMFGCREGQGHLFHRAVDARTMLSLLAEPRPAARAAERPGAAHPPAFAGALSRA